MTVRSSEHLALTANRPAGRAMRVASVPASHVYVRHLDAPAGPRTVARLPDPDPLRPDRPARQRWWPPAMLDPEWAAAADFDIFHVHFGFDARRPDELRDLVDVLRSRGKPLVYTVHDLRNPHHVRPDAHDAHLDVLVPSADVVITLTRGAAEDIRRRWGREAVVLPHPHVVGVTTMRRVRRERSRRPGDVFRVGLHLKSLRASMDPAAVLPPLLDVVRRLPGAVLQVNGHRDVLGPAGERRDDVLAAWLEREAQRGRLDLRVHDFLPDDELWAYLASLDVSVLPYRFGTHSGWLEACRDLGTTVVAPTCGHFAGQGPVLTYGHDESGLDEASLTTAIEYAYAERPDYGASPAERLGQRRSVARAHDDLYRALLT
jgi:hypothetical protein